MKLLKNTLFMLFVSVAIVACAEADEKTTEEETTNTQEQMKVVQPVIDTSYEAAAEGDSTLLEDDRQPE